MSDCVCVVVGVCVGGGGGLKKSQIRSRSDFGSRNTLVCEALGAQTGPTSSLSAGPGHRARASQPLHSDQAKHNCKVQKFLRFENINRKKSAQVGRHVEASPQWQEEWRKNPRALARTTLLQIV